MAAIDFTRLRNQTMTDGFDSEVTVNTRALIDKVLARYSSEHTTLRELIQNAADAKASTVIIKLETDPSLNVPTPQGAADSVLLKHIIQHHTLKRLVVRNNGQPFTAADWSRLKSIADGNPDETKIGAFGVGFYSVFADCDEPLVVSGDKTMAFYWKANTLSTKMATVPAEHKTSDTIFSLDYRQANLASPSYNPSKLPNLPTLCRFLATSLTFVGLDCIELHVDDYVVASFAKKISPPEDLQVPQGLKTQTAGDLMRVTHVTRQNSQIDAQWLNVIASAQNPPKRATALVQQEVRNAGTTLRSFFSKFSAPAAQAPPSRAIKYTATEKPNVSEEIAGESKGTIFLQICNVEVKTRVSQSFAAEIERATKKAPPKTTKIALLTSPFQDPSATTSVGSGLTADLASKIFAEVLPTTSGRIFIGFPTAQTTGYLAHISAPSLIPTVERENVDMNARYISTWNKELLRVAGLACRLTYVSEMAAIQNRVGRESIDSLVPRAIYTFQQYTATASHPSTSLGETIDEAFWSCSQDRSIDILSTKGVMSSKYVRMPAETLSFLGEVPMVPQELANGAVTFMLNLHNRGFITELTLQDICRGLETRALNEDELCEFLKWCGSKLESGEIDVPGSRNLLENTVANIDVQPEKNSGRIITLGNISTYVNASRITPTLPLPPDTMPFAFTKSLPPKQLQMFGWVELSMVRWLRHMTTQPQLDDFTKDENLATSVLTLASKCWEQLDASSKETVVKILTPHPIMPTKSGLRRPAEAYFPTVKLFDDLPTVKTFPGSKEKFLLALSVRKTIDLPVVFDRMRNRDTQSERGSWNHADLIRYFASVIDELPQNDLNRLRETPFLPGDGVSVKQGQLFKASDLYAPDQAIMALGLTQIKLPFEFKPGTREGVLLVRLGLKPWPDSLTIAHILNKAGQARDQQLYKLALEYFIQNYYKNNYPLEAAKFAALTIPILPTEQAPFPALVGPFQCYTNENAASLGFAILRSDLRLHAEKFGVKKDPNIGPCVQYLLNTPPKTKLDAEMQFAYFASRASDLDQSKSLITSLSAASIVPIFRKYYLESTSVGFEDRTKRQSGKSEMRIHHYDPPEHVFVGRDQEYRGILDYVQYGAEATAFLLKVGAKHEPSTHDLAKLLAKNPARFLNTIGQEKYLDLLRKLAEHAGAIWKDKDLVKLLIASRILLGYRDVKADVPKVAAEEEEEFDDLDEPNVHREWSLNKQNEIVIIDNVNYLTKFRDFIIAAPQEEQLEEFYARFGVQKVSDLVKTDQRIGTAVRDQSPAQDLRKDILERARIFLHEYERDASSKAIRHDAKWLASNLTVQCVSDISTRYSLAERNVATSSRRSAVIVKVRSTGYVLSVTPKYDLYEVSSELVRLLIARPKRNDAIALERILTEPLRRLQQKGINVERILRRKEFEARIARQHEQEREEEEQARLAEQSKSGLVKTDEREHGPPATPDKSNQMPGAFGSPDTGGMEVANHNHRSNDRGLLNNWAKKLGLKNTPSAPSGGTDGPQISRDIAATKSNIANAIKDCRPTGMANINTKIHQDPTELDRGGYCNGEQWENLHKAFSVPWAGRHIDVYYGRDETSSHSDLQSPLSAFLPLIVGLTSIFQVDPAAVNIFFDRKSHTVAFNMSGSLFFNLAWFMALHSSGWGTREGRLRALDSWFLTYCHELAHNLVGDHNARHSWYQQQIAIEYSQRYREGLEGYLQGLSG